MPIKYNYSSNAEKYAQLYRLQELLRLEHNINGAKFKAGQITKNEWDNYLIIFTTKNDELCRAICNIRQLIKTDASINTSLNDLS